MIQVVLAVRAVPFLEIEGWIGKHGINGFGPDQREHVKAIGMEQRASICPVNRLRGDGRNVDKRAHIEESAVEAEGALSRGA